MAEMICFVRFIMSVKYCVCGDTNWIWIFL